MQRAFTTALSNVLGWALLPAALLLTPTACGGGGGGGGVSDLLANSLNRLGVPTTETLREQEPGVAVASSYAPFGASWDVAVTKEMLILGMDIALQPGLPVTLSDLTDAQGHPVRNQLFAGDPGTASWAVENLGNNRPEPRTLRAAVAADYDGDGREEVVVVYQRQSETRLYVIDDATMGFATMDVQVASQSGVTSVAAAAGDFDGDGDDEIAVGVTRDGIGELSFLAWDGTRFAPVGPTKSFVPLLAGGSLSLQIVTGNLDYDRGGELALVVNERLGTHTPTGSTRYAVLDDMTTEFATLREDLVTGRGANGVPGTAVSATVAIGDIDGDNLGEVVLGGVEQFARFCDAAPYLLVALDDAAHGLTTIAGHRFQHSFSSCDSPDDPQVRIVNVRTLDLDGDGAMEIVANRFVFDDFAHNAPWTEMPAWDLPDSTIWAPHAFGHFDATTTAWQVGDFTGDNRDDIAVFHQDLSRVQVYGLSAIAAQIELVREIPVQASGSQTPINPIVLPVNVDVDGPVLKYSDADYQLVFSEPVVIAALAAAPFRDGIGQNVGGSFTAFGNTTSTGSQHERTVSFTASASVGVKFDGGPLTQSELELKVTATRQATQREGTAYTLAKTILFNSAPSEDTVVFTSVPIDRYVYTIVSHPDPTLIGRKVAVNMPREPVTRQAERGFFNRTVLSGSIQIDDSVFTHSIGEPTSYPTRAQKIALLAGSGMEVGPIGVPQGGGSTTLVLEVGEEISEGGALQIGYEASFEATKGTLLGSIAVGSSHERSWQITSGQSTTYTGQVGGIPAATFAANQYQWGIFTYVRTDRASGTQFEVVNYWVED